MSAPTEPKPKPPPANFRQWAAHHSELFGLSEKEDKTLVAWEKIFRDTATADLVDASDFIAANPETLTKSEARFLGKMNLHLAAIRQRITDRRAITYATKRDDLDRDRGTCDRCSSSGFVVVPHIRSIKDGEWRPMHVARGGATYYTQAVQCSCAKGNWLHQHADPERRPMKIEAYIVHNPLWEIQLQKRNREANAVAAATAKPGDEDVLNRFAESLKARVEQALAPAERGTLPFEQPKRPEQPEQPEQEHNSLATWQRRHEERNGN